MYRRAPFIWWPGQKIEPAGIFLTFAGMPPRDEGKNRWFFFRKRIDISEEPEAARLSLTTDGKYRLYVNGEPVGRGPVRADPNFQRVDTYEWSAKTPFRQGENAIGVLVHTYGVDTAQYQMVRGLWRDTFGDGALMLDGLVQAGDGDITVRTGPDWRCLKSDAWTEDVPQSNNGLGFIEDLDARRLPEGWAEPGFDDGKWEAAQVLTALGGGPEAHFGGMKTEPFPVLLPSEIPFLEKTPLAPRRVVNRHGVEPDPSLALEDRIYREALCALPEGALENPDALLEDDETATVVRTGDDRDITLLLDFGRIHAGHPFIEIEARGGEVIELAASEKLPGEWEEGFDDETARVAREPTPLGLDAHLARYTARPGRQRFERFEWTAVRWLQVTVRNAPEGLKIRHIGSLHTRYPAERRGRFECSDPFLDTLWTLGRTTLEECMHDAWEDCPSREQRQWLGDATIEYLVGQAAHGPSVNALNAKFLKQCAESQRVDGLTQMFAPGDHKTNALLIPDWTLQWIINAEQHWLYSGDLQIVEDVLPAIERALQWFARHIGPSGLLADVPHWNFMDWAGLGRDGEASAMNALYVGALRAAARLSEAAGNAGSATRWTALADAIAAVLSERHWDEARGCYVDMVDPATGEQRPRVSQHGNAAMILWGIAPVERWERIVAYITDKERLTFTKAPGVVPTGETLDEETGCVLANTFFSHFVYEALAKAGRRDLMLDLIRERYGPMVAKDATTLWESYAPTASLCHGFSASPTSQLSTKVLGVTPIAPGFRRFRFSPWLGDLERAEGVFPTVMGDIAVSLQGSGDGGMEAALTVPRGCEAVLDDAEGYAFEVEAGVLGPGEHKLKLRAD